VLTIRSPAAQKARWMALDTLGRGAGGTGENLMCLYMNPPMKKKTSPALLKLLNGKTCFHWKAIDDGLKKDIDAALTASVKYYKKRGWV
jgi:hypothetical protein